ncbi:hypothetical protein L6164_031672 [Bauhinia variegata]|uniref:Uncharacterized protein n=1 Tax=Bauhinia variegata TaxID=167791 RepID=A0ACB9LHC1_BAUVA|nr:hypothetical protein L6164_031672 [Bauhinia variegata]
MAMSETMAGPNEWLNFYQPNFLPPPAEATTVATTAVTASQASSSPLLGMLSSSSSPTTTSPSTHLSPEGRVSKPVRRRSRASRRTPTTLLNTDTTNFRAMVQQFTGGPSGPFAPTASVAGAGGLPNLGFGFGSRHMSPAGLMVAAPSGYHLHQQLHQQPQPHHIYGISSHNSNTEGGESTFFQRLNNNPRPGNDHGDGFLMDQGGRFFPNASS